MDGILFYWAGWMYIIVVYFLLDSKYPRSYLLSIGFVSIIFSQFSYTNDLLEWNFAYIPFLIICIKIMKDLAVYQITFGYLLSIFIAAWFVIVHRVTFLEPVWLFFSPKWMIIGLAVILLIILVRSWQLRIFILCIGIFQGLVLSKISHYLHTGTNSWSLYGFNSMTVLEILAMSILYLVIWTGLEKIAASLKESVIMSKPVVMR